MVAALLSLAAASTTSGCGRFGFEPSDAGAEREPPAPWTTFSLALLDDGAEWSWVYQNTPQSTADRHRCELKIGVAGSADPLGYQVTVSELGGGQHFIIEKTQDPLRWTVKGGRRVADLGPPAYPAAEPGAYVLIASITGMASHQTRALSAELTLRTLGDTDGQNGVTQEDEVALEKTLAQLPTGYPRRAFDLDGDGAVDQSDVTLINRILNGLPVP